MGISQDFNHLNPVMIDLASTEAIRHLVHRRMTYRAADGSMSPELAVRIPTLQNKKLQRKLIHGKKRAWAEWEIRADAKWGDGQPITCKDWQFSWKIGMNDKVLVIDRSFYSKIRSLEWSAQQPKLCFVTYEDDNWGYDRDLPEILPAHIEAPVFEKWAQQSEAYNQNTSYVTNPQNPGLYSGPYVVKDFKPGSHIVFEANPHFYGNKPQIQKITLKLVSDTNTLRAQLLSGDLNMIMGIGLTTDIALQMQDEFKRKSLPFTVRFINSPIFQTLALNLEDKVLQDQNVRQALKWAVDKKTLTQSFFKAQLQPAEGLLSPNDPWFTVFPTEFQPKKAEELLEKSGWKKGPDGIRAKNGQRLSVVFRVSSGFKILETIQTFVCDHWRRLGVECLIQNQPPRVLLGTTLSKGDYSLAIFGSPSLHDYTLKSLFHTSAIPSGSNSWSGQNNTRWKNSQVDKLLEQYDLEWSKEKRKKLMQSLEKHFRDELPMIPLYHRRETVVLPAQLTGFEDSALATDLAHPENWKM